MKENSEIPDMDGSLLESPDAKTEVLLAATLEYSWLKLPPILKRLPTVKQIGYKRSMLSTHVPLSSLLSSWEKYLQDAISLTQFEAVHNTIPSHNLTENEARIVIITNSYPRILKDLNELVRVENTTNWIPRRDPNASSFLQTLQAFRSTLPWNRTGFNEITPNSISQVTSQKALKYIHTL